MTTAYTQHRHPCASLDSIRVSDAMHRGVVTCAHDATLCTVARLFAAHRIHAVVVAPQREEDDWGIVSDLDLAGALSGRTLGARAGEVASTPSVFVNPEERLTRAAQLMREYDTHHVIVLVRGSHHPIGIVSTLDIADAVAELPHTPEMGGNNR